MTLDAECIALGRVLIDRECIVLREAEASVRAAGGDGTDTFSSSSTGTMTSSLAASVSGCGLASSATSASLAPDLCMPLCAESAALAVWQAAAGCVAVKALVWVRDGEAEPWLPKPL